MLIDLRRDPEATLAPAEFCVVGAGPAGQTIARVLAEARRDVILLESGGEDFEAATQQLYRGRNLGLPYYDLDASRLRFFGGSAALSAGWTAPFDAIDFARRDWVPGSGWPFARAELDGWYAEAQRLLGLADAEDCPATAIGNLATGAERCDEDRARFRAAHQAPLIDLPTLRVFTHANAVALHASPDARRIERIDVRCFGGGEDRPITARHFVLACGAIENSRLLLVSNDVEPRGIGNRHDQVGRYFMDQPVARIGHVALRDAEALLDRFRAHRGPDGICRRRHLRLPDDAQQRLRTLNGAIALCALPAPEIGNAIAPRLSARLRRPFDAFGGDGTLERLRGWLRRSVGEPLAEAAAMLKPKGIHLLLRGEPAPNPDSRVVLAEKHDALGRRRADLDWRLGELDRRSARKLGEACDAALRDAGAGAAEPPGWLAARDEGWPIDAALGARPFAAYHQSGGTRMGTDPRSSVTDADGRVHGYANLWIAGSSTFPTAGSVGPMLTVLALALRLAARLQRD